MNDDKLEEVDCPNCNGTGKIKRCPLCHGFGFIADMEEIEENKGMAWGTKPCPNGCERVTLIFQAGDR